MSIFVSVSSTSEVPSGAIRLERRLTSPQLTHTTLNNSQWKYRDETAEPRGGGWINIWAVLISSKINCILSFHGINPLVTSANIGNVQFIQLGRRGKTDVQSLDIHSMTSQWIKQRCGDSNWNLKFMLVIFQPKWGRGGRRGWTLSKLPKRHPWWH